MNKLNYSWLCWTYKATGHGMWSSDWCMYGSSDGFWRADIFKGTYEDIAKAWSAERLNTNGDWFESTGHFEKNVKEPTTLRDKIKALTDGKEYTEEVANQVGDLLRQELLKNKEFKAIIDNATDRNDEAICKEWGKLYKESLHVDKDYQGTLDEIQRVKEEIFQKY